MLNRCNIVAALSEVVSESGCSLVSVDDGSVESSSSSAEAASIEDAASGETGEATSDISGCDDRSDDGVSSGGTS